MKRTFEKKASLQEMFERRRVSLKKLAAKQTRPVQPVAPRPESLSSPGMYVCMYLYIYLSFFKCKMEGIGLFLFQLTGIMRTSVLVKTQMAGCPVKKYV